MPAVFVPAPGGRTVIRAASIQSGASRRRPQSVRRSLPRYRIVGIENSAPSLMPDGQRDVIVFVRVQNLIESGPCWLRSPKDEDFQPPKEW